MSPSTTTCEPSTGEPGQLTLFMGGSPAPPSPLPGNRGGSNRTVCFGNLSECAEKRNLSTSSQKTSRTLSIGGERQLGRSKVWGTTWLTAFLTPVISDCLKPEEDGLPWVFDEECCLVHNLYGGFGEGKPRIFAHYSPTLRTPKGGGHIPSVLSRSGELSCLPVEKAEMLMGFPIGWTALDA